MSGTFSSYSNPTPAEPTGDAKAAGDIMDAPITPLPVKPLAPEPDDAENPILASANDGAFDGSQDPSTQAFKPQVFRRKSNNYEEAADASSSSATKSDSFSATKDLDSFSGQAESILGPSSSEKIGNLVDTDSKQKGPEGVGGDNWKPTFERKQSWDQQEWKHDLQIKVAGKPEEKAADGFTETGSGHTKRYSQS